MLHDDLLKPGARLDRYELLAPRARGGMGTVWLARLVGKYGFARLFAVKTIRAEYAREADFRAMFLDEARVASRIQDEHVVQVVELGEHEDLLYLVMDWVDGDSLTHFTARARKSMVPVGVAVRTVIDATKGLQAAHEARDDEGRLLDVVHRDVSPHNLLVTRRGTTKVIDFGIAKARDRIAADSSHGSVKGKVSYLAPEQVLGMRLGPHTDVFSLGCVLYELLSGWTPYGPGTEAEIIARHLKRERIEPPLVDGALRDVLSTALAVDPADRYPSMESFREALEAAVRKGNMEATDEAVSGFASDVLIEPRREREAFVHVALSWAKLREESVAPESSPVSASAPANEDETSTTRRPGAQALAAKHRSKKTLWLALAAVTASAASLIGLGVASRARVVSREVASVEASVVSSPVRLDAPVSRPAAPAPSALPEASAPGTANNVPSAPPAIPAVASALPPIRSAIPVTKSPPAARGHEVANANAYTPPATQD